MEQSAPEVEELVNISWPTTVKAQLTYLFLAPIMLPLYYTLPDTKNPVSLVVIQLLYSIPNTLISENEFLW